MLTMRKREIFRMLMIVGVWAFGLLAYAQQSSLVTGNVVDQDGEPIPGVNIIIKGTSTGSVSDFDGNFQLQVPDAANAVLVFCFIGFDELEIPVQKRSSLVAVLKPTSRGLEEVVAIGYGTAKRRDLTGSVSSVGETILR